MIFIGKCGVVKVLSPHTTCARTAPPDYDLVNHFGCYHNWLFFRIFLVFSQCKWCTKTQFIATTHPPTTPCSFLINKWSELVWIKSLEVHNKICELFNPLISFHHFVKLSNHWLYIIMCHGLYEMLVFNAPHITHTSIANASSSTFPAWLTILTHPLLFPAALATVHSQSWGGLSHLSTSSSLVYASHWLGLGTVICHSFS